MKISDTHAIVNSKAKPESGYASGFSWFLSPYDIPTVTESGAVLQTADPPEVKTKG